MEWGKDDCLIDLFGVDAHEKISWLKETHNETLGWVLSLPISDRISLFTATLEGQGYVPVKEARPGDVVIGHFKLGVNHDFDLPSPWFAQMWNDNNWYVRLPKMTRVVELIVQVEVYRCQRLQSEL